MDAAAMQQQMMQQQMVQQQMLQQQMMMQQQARMQQAQQMQQPAPPQQMPRHVPQVIAPQQIPPPPQSAAPAAPAQPPQSFKPPNDSPTMPGVTDKRHQGVIVSILPEKGYGFIRSPGLREIFPSKDVFLHKNQMAAFNEGDPVEFSVFVNKGGNPNGHDLSPGVLTPEIQDSMNLHNRRQTAAGAPAGTMPTQPHGTPGVAQPPLPAPAAALYADGFHSSSTMGYPMQSNADEVYHEVDLPAELTMSVLFPGIEDLKQRVGGDVRIDLVGSVDEKSRKFGIRGPAVSAGLATCLMLQLASDLI